jgi:hypothetical protein
MLTFLCARHGRDGHINGPAHSILGLVRNRRSVRKLRSALEYFPNPGEVAVFTFPLRPFLNLHKIRVDSDNKR